MAYEESVAFFRTLMQQSVRWCGSFPAFARGCGICRMREGFPIVLTRWLTRGRCSMPVVAGGRAHIQTSWPARLHGCGQRGLAYLFKLRLTAGVKRRIERLSTQRVWKNSGGVGARGASVRGGT